jgi:hypothetical protein
MYTTSWSRQVPPCFQVDVHLKRTLSNVTDAAWRDMACAVKQPKRITYLEATRPYRVTGLRLAQKNLGFMPSKTR